MKVYDVRATQFFKMMVKMPTLCVEGEKGCLSAKSGC